MSAACHRWGVVRHTGGRPDVVLSRHKTLAAAQQRDLWTAPTYHDAIRRLTKAERGLS